MRTDVWSVGTLPRGTTQVSPEFPNDFLPFGPVVLGVERSQPAPAENNPESINVALTVYRTTNGRFRIAATNVSGTNITSMVVRWWTLQAVVV